MSQLLFDAWDEQKAAVAIERVTKQSITLRPYQLDAVNAAYKEWDRVQCTMIHAATGLGKSVMFSEVMRRWDVATQGRILLVAHRDELIYQAVGHAKKAKLTTGIEKASLYANAQAQVVVAMVQSLNGATNCKHCFGEGCDQCSSGKAKRFTRFNPRDFGLIVIDEAHHAVADSHRNYLKYFGQNPNLKTLMVTATPKRADKKGMHNVCQSVAYTMDLKDGIEGGWLVPIRQKFVTVDGLDISAVKTSKGDLQSGQLEQAFLGTDEAEERMLHAIAKPTLMEANGRKTLVFASGKEHAEKLSACFNANGATSEVITDDTLKKDRSNIVDEFTNGDLQVLVNCLCLTEGFDAPATAVIANCRPTKSESLYLQIIGRGTRTLPGVVDGPATAEERKAAIAASDKTHCVVLDFCGNSGEHKLISVADVLAGDKVDPIDLKEAIALAKESGETVDIEVLAEKVKQAREATAERKEQERLKRLMTNTKADHADYSAVDVDLFGGYKFKADAEDPNKITKGQIRFLAKLGINPKKAKHMSKRQASAIIDKSFRKVEKDWKVIMSQATSQSELYQIGKQIAARQQNDYMLADKKVTENLRKAYKERRAELNG